MSKPGSYLRAGYQLLRRRLLEPPAEALVLMYHCVRPDDFNPYGLVVQPQHFEAQLRHLQAHYEVISTADLQELLAGGKALPRKAVCITFDDGYADNLHYALPILDSLGLPATFFITTGKIGTPGHFWWDLLAWWTRPEHRGALEKLPPDHWLRTGARTFKALQNRLRNTEAGILGKWIDETEALLDIPLPENYRLLNWDELRRMASSPQVSIGVHTVSHANLGVESAQSQAYEISASIRTLAEELGRPINQFSLPFGQKDNYSRTTIDILQQEGIAMNFTTQPSGVHKASDLLQLPRIMVADLPAESFARAVKAFF